MGAIFRCVGQLLVAGPRAWVISAMAMLAEVLLVVVMLAEPMAVEPMPAEAMPVGETSAY